MDIKTAKLATALTAKGYEDYALKILGGRVHPSQLGLDKDKLEKELVRKFDLDRLPNAVATYTPDQFAGALLLVFELKNRPYPFGKWVEVLQAYPQVVGDARIYMSVDGVDHYDEVKDPKFIRFLGEFRNDLVYYIDDVFKENGVDVDVDDVELEVEELE